MSTITSELNGSPSRPAPVTAAGRRTKSLRKKTFFTVAGTLFALILILSIGLSWMLAGRFKDVEMHDAARDVQTAGATLAAYFVPLRATALDWSAWDDSYKFVQDGNPAYRQENLTPFGLDTLEAEFVVYVRPDGHVTYGTGIDIDNGSPRPLPASVSALLTPDDLLVRGPSQDQRISGFLALPEGTLLVVAYPIVHSDGSGPSQGAFIIGRFLTEPDLANVQSVNHLKSLTLEPRSAPNLPSTMTSAIKRLDAGSTTVVQPVNGGLMLSSMLVPDVFDRPTFILQAGIDRSTYRQARTAVRDLVVALVIVGGVFLGLTLLLLERLVLRRLATVNQGVRSIGSRRDLAMRLDPDGADEIGQLAAAINQMLQDLEDAQVREHRLNEQITQLHIQIDQTRRDREVARITDSEYFRSLAERAEKLRRRSSRASRVTD